MSTFTKEQLIARINQVTAINKYRISRDTDADGLVMDNELFAIALASLEAEAVGYFGRFDADDEDLIDQCSQNIKGAFPLYAAPPAPVSVPDEKGKADDFELNGPLSCYQAGKIDGWNACRAAMLHGAEPVSNRDELTDGWVACSKRMPSPSTGVIVAAPWQSAPCGYAMKWATNCPGHPDADIDGWIIPGASWSPTHWMPLPAAPQQEVK